jgi:hypothetical protein
MSISYTLTEKSNMVLRDRDDYGDNNDFSSKKELKQAVKYYFKNYECPSCGSRRTGGRGVVVKYGKVEFYKEVPYKGFFGKTKYRDECYKTIWRIHGIELITGQKGGILDSGIAPGRMFCKSKGCGWEVVAPIYPKKSRIVWYSINDVLQGKPFRK